MPDDKLLILALQAGDPAAFQSLFESYADRLYNLALRLLRDPREAEDVVQDTFIKAITRLDQFEGRSNLGTWLYRVAYNASMDRLRREDELPLLGDDLGEDDDLLVAMPNSLVEWDTPERLILDGEARLLLDGAIHQLPETLRAVFILRDIEELSTDETAEVLSISPGAVKVRLHRARLALRESLAAHFADRQLT